MKYDRITELSKFVMSCWCVLIMKDCTNVNF